VTVSKRIEIQQICDDGIEAQVWSKTKIGAGPVVETRRANVERTAPAGHGIRSRASTGWSIQDSGASAGRRHRADFLSAEVESIAFIVEEEKHFFLFDGTADRATELPSL